jgi:hypothetical protein
LRRIELRLGTPAELTRYLNGAEISFPLSLPSSASRIGPIISWGRKAEIDAGHGFVHEAPSHIDISIRAIVSQAEHPSTSHSMSTVPFAVVPVIDLNNTVGALEIGVQISTFLFGILSCQSTVSCLSISSLGFNMVDIQHGSTIIDFLKIRLSQSCWYAL